MEDVWVAERDGKGGETGEGAAATHIVVIVVSGHGEAREMEIDVNAQADVMLRVIADERGCSIEELILVREDDGPTGSVRVPHGAPIGHGYPHHRRHHVHHVGNVDVTVHYQGGHDHREFARHDLLKAVLDSARSGDFRSTRRWLANSNSRGRGSRRSCR